MILKVFKRYQEESLSPFMCINDDHAMPLVPYLTDDLIVKLKCFVYGCNYTFTPGSALYEKIKKSLTNV